MEVAQDRSDCLLEQLEQSHTSTIGHSVVRLEVGLEVGLVEQQVEMSASQELTERVIISDRHTCPLSHPSCYFLPPPCPEQQQS